MTPIFCEDGDNFQIAVPSAEALEIAQALLRATTKYPDCEFEIRFTEEKGTLKWVVKAIAPPSDGSNEPT